MMRLAGGLTVAAIALAVTSSAAAAGPSPVPRSTWVPNGGVNAVEVIGDKAYIAGSFSRVGPYTGGSARVDRATGEALAGWPQAAGQVYAIEPDGAGGWFLGGEFDGVGGVPRSNLAHVLADGSVDPAFAPAADRTISTMLRIGSVLYIGGEFTSVNGQPRSGLAGVSVANGALTAFAPTLTGLIEPRVRALTGRSIAGSTTLFVGGVFSTVDGASRTGVAAFTDGVLNGYAPSLNGVVEDLWLDGFSGLYAVGDFTVANGQARVGGAYLTGTNGTTTGAWAPQISGDDGDPLPLTIFDMERTGSTIYLAGEFQNAGGSPRSNLAAVSATTGTATAWTPATEPDGANRVLLDVAPSPDGTTVYAAGSRHGVRAYDAATGQRSSWAPVGDTQVDVVVPRAGDVLIAGSIATAGGVARDGFAELDLNSGRATALDLSVDGFVADMAHSGRTLYVVGNFAAVAGPGGGTRVNAASLDTSGGRWSGFFPTVNLDARAVEVDGTTVYVLYSSSIRAFRDDPPGSGANPLPRSDPSPDAGAGFLALSVGPDSLYVGGDFGGVRQNPGDPLPIARHNLFAVERETFAIRPWNPNADNAVRALARSGSTLLAGGAFGVVNGGVARPRIAGFDPVTGAATSFAAPNGAEVAALAVLDSTLLVGRSTGASLAQLDAATGASSAWQPGLTEAGAGGVADLVVSPERGVFAAGTLTVALGPVPTANLAIFPLSPPAPTQVAATAGDAQASVAFASPGDGGSPVTEYTVTASPGGATATGSGSPISVGGLANGTPYTFTVRATNAVGASPESQPSAPVTPQAAPRGGDGTAVRSPRGGDRTAPVLRRFTVRPRRFRRKRGTRITVRLSERATVRFDLLEPERGRRVRRKCRRQTRANRRRPSCTRLVRRGGVKRRLGTRPPAFRFRAPKVKPGRYVLRATPTDASGNVGRGRKVAVAIRR